MCAEKGIPENAVKKGETSRPGEGKGVIRDKAEFGNPIGTTCLDEVADWGYHASQCVGSADVDDAEGMKKLAVIQENLSKRSTVHIGSKKSENNPEVMVASLSFNRKVDDDPMDDIWDSSHRFGAGGSSAPKAPGLGPSVPKISKLKSSASKIDQEVSKSESIILNVNQLLRTLCNNETYNTVLPKYCKQLLDKVTARLTPEFQELYTRDVDPETSSTHLGLLCMENLRKASTALSLANAVAEVIQATDINIDLYRGTHLKDSCQFGWIWDIVVSLLTNNIDQVLDERLSQRRAFG